MLTAILLAATIQTATGPSLPPGAHPELHSAFQAIAGELSQGRFDQARAKSALLPRRTVTFAWDVTNLPANMRQEWGAVRNRAFKDLAVRMNGLSFKESAKPAIRFGFEKSLAADPGSGLPRGIALFFSENSNSPRVEAVIGLKRGNPLENTSLVSLYNEIVFAVGSYLGMTQSPFLGSVMGRTDLQMQQESNPDVVELGAWDAINTAVKQMDSFIAKKQRISIGKPKAVFNPLVVERGPVIQGTPIDFTVQVSNQGNSPLHFRVIPDCGCVTAAGSPVVSPGAAVAVKIHVDTKDISGELNKHLILVSNDADQPYQRFPIHIKTTPRYRFLSNSPQILIADENGVDTELFLVTPESKPFKILDVELNGLAGTVSAEAWTGSMADPELNEPSKPRVGHRIKVHLDEPTVNGRPAATVVVKTDDPSYGTIRSMLYVQKGIAILPGSIFFGDLGKAERSASIILTRLNKPFKITKIESDSSFVAGSFIETRGGWEYRITCRYDGKAPPGDLRAMVTIHTDDKRQPKIKIPVMGVVR
jgi:hypothetical protein